MAALRRRYLRLEKGTDSAKFARFASRVAQLNASGVPLRKIADELGVSRPTPTYWMKKFGHEIFRWGGRSSITHKGIPYYLETWGGYTHGKRNGPSIYLHRVLWEERHGPIPPGYRLTFRSKNKADFSDENLFLQTVSEWAGEMGRRTQGKRRIARERTQPPPHRSQTS